MYCESSTELFTGTGPLHTCWWNPVSEDSLVSRPPRGADFGWTMFPGSCFVTLQLGCVWGPQGTSQTTTAVRQRPCFSCAGCVLLVLLYLAMLPAGVNGWSSSYNFSCVAGLWWEAGDVPLLNLVPLACFHKPAQFPLCVNFTVHVQHFPLCYAHGHLGTTVTLLLCNRQPYDYPAPASDVSIICVWIVSTHLQYV